MVTSSLAVSHSFNKSLSQAFSQKEIPHIYVACLSAYNNGRLHGAWIDASLDVPSIHKKIRKMLSKSPIPHAEEWAIHTCEGFGSLTIGEYEQIEEVQAKAQFIVEHGALGAELIGHYGGCLGDAQYAMENHYCGPHDSELAYATHLFDECHLDTASELIRNYFDYEKFSRDIFIVDYFSLDAGDRIHVFERY